MSIFDWWLKVMKSIFIFQKLKKEKRYQIPRYIIVSTLKKFQINFYLIFEKTGVKIEILIFSINLLEIFPAHSFYPHKLCKIRFYFQRCYSVFIG